MKHARISKAEVKEVFGISDEELLRLQKKVSAKIKNYERITGTKINLSPTEFLNEFARDTINGKRLKQSEQREMRLREKKIVLETPESRKIGQKTQEKIKEKIVNQIDEGFKNLINARGKYGQMAREFIKKMNETGGSAKERYDGLKNIGKMADTEKGAYNAQNKSRRIGERRAFKS